jgi:hypothetical protein
MAQDANICILVSLAADFILWAASPGAAFLKGKLIWCNWDVDEMKEKEDQILSSSVPGYLNLGMIGWPFHP